MTITRNITGLIKLAMLLLPAPLLSAQVATEAETAPPTTGPISRLDDLNWKARHEAKLLEASSRPVHLVLLGDSITANYELKGPELLRDYSGVWHRYYADRFALNLGFSGDGTQHLLWRIMHGEINNIAPKVAVILIGTNDIGWLHRTAADTVAGIDAVVTELHLRVPATKILLVGLLPSERGASVRRATAEINFALAARYSNGQLSYVTYRDISPVFLNNGVLDTSLFSDPQQVSPEPALHPSPEGQERMATALEPTLSELLGDARHDRCSDSMITRINVQVVRLMGCWPDFSCGSGQPRSSQTGASSRQACYTALAGSFSMCTIKKWGAAERNRARTLG